MLPFDHDDPLMAGMDGRLLIHPMNASFSFDLYFPYTYIKGKESHSIRLAWVFAVRAICKVDG
jgi:hypothetical protein